ncbi:MAG TPA: hypothetical protein VKZ82_07010 [Nonomuraea sp.]|uniref:hypothetical protein n=1 Tax=Nonomuraea sp. NPDC049649 TaxID=3155776 RepID=UPI002B83394C|nr:hypothetical protein [Nonomuraea sp.]
MTDNVIAVVMVFLSLFLAGGVISLIRQGMKTGAAVCGLGAAMALFAGVMWW